MTELAPELALAAICGELVRLGRRFALVGGLAVSVRAEVRFTRGVDIAVAVLDDLEAESLTYELRAVGYFAVASVEHETRRVGTVPVANAEELLAMKVLSMTDTRLQDRIDAQHLLQFTPELDIATGTSSCVC